VKATLAPIFAVAVTVLHAQTPPVFEVASVRQSNPQDPSGRIQYLPGGRFNATACRLSYLIQRLYGVRGFQILNAPKWISEADSRFTIQAKAAESVGNDQLRLMAQSLLAERFQFKFHREARDLNVYALVIGKNGPKLQVAKENGQPRGTGAIEAPAPAGWLRGANVSLSLLAEALSGGMDRPIVDGTNFTDPIDFSLQWTTDRNPDDTHPSFVTAVQEQLGLRLEPQRLPFGMLVVDRLEHPTAN